MIFVKSDAIINSKRSRKRFKTADKFCGVSFLMKRDFSQVLREFLKDNRMTQIAFARAIGADKDQVSRWLKGQSAPNYWEIQKMSTVFDISADYFLGLSESY